MVDIASSEEVNVQIPQKVSVIGKSAGTAFSIGAVTTGLGSLMNVSRQEGKPLRDFIKAQKEINPKLKTGEIKELFKRDVANDIVEFSKASHSKWVTAGLTAGLAAGATVGAISAMSHNKQVDSFRERLEAEEAARAIAAQQGQAKS